MKLRFVFLALLTVTLLALAVFWWPQPVAPQPDISLSTGTPATTPSPAPNKLPLSSNLTALKNQMLAQLTPPQKKPRLLDLPAPPIEETPSPAPTTAATPDARQKGRTERKDLPLGVVLFDHTPVYKKASGSDVFYTMETGDFVKVVPTNVVSTSDETARLQVHPGEDIYLAATSKEIKPAGERFPDADCWIERKDLFIFEPEQAKQFTSGVDPMTLGTDPNFSTVAFYERALKNPDPVVHRVIGPRLIAILSVHEDYLFSWGTLYRDPDSKIRSVTLSALRQRGVGNSRHIIEDLIKRLADLTTVPAQGETEAEVITILAILEESHHPRVPVALQGFEETWKQTQSDKVMESLRSAMRP